MTDTIAFDEQAVVERARVLSREEIAACTERALLVTLQADYEDALTSIEVMLQYPDEPRDAEWYRRARGALIVHKVGLGRVKRRLRELQNEAEKAARLAKVADRLADPV